MILAHQGQGQAVIFVGPKSTWLERHAADELKHYLQAISGAELPVTDRWSDASAVVAIGRPETNPLIADACRRGLVRLSEDFPGLDGFLIETLKLDNRDVLILGGSQDRSALYAVYSLLEGVLGVGFFRDGEQIPDMPTIELPDIKIAERPRFSDRQEGNGCIYRYSTFYWTWEDWKRELDWRAKRRVNMIWPFNVGGDITGSILAEWGVLPKPKAPSELTSLHEQAFEYAHKIGIRIPCILPNGAMPDAFFKKYPGCRSLLIQWSELAPTRQIHPGDPMFRRLIVDYIRHYRERYGTDHLYIADFAPESMILEGADDPNEARLNFARGVSDAIREADPEGVWLPSTWPFDFDAEPPMRWTIDDVREYLDAITTQFVVWDAWSEEAAKYEPTDFFFGKPWGFGILYTFGGNGYLHGDVAGLIDQVHSLIENPKADRCVLFSSMPEMIQYNGFYLELCAQLSWDPSRVTLDGYLEDYCVHRYGEEIGRNLKPAWGDLLETVYGPDSGSIILLMDPLYWLRPNLELLHGPRRLRAQMKELWPKRKSFIPKLRHAIEVFLAQPDLLQRSYPARRDLVDIARQWIAERFDQEIRRARDAFLQSDASGFEDASASCLSLLDQQIRLLASWPPYRLDRKIESARAIHGDDASRAVKHIHVWVITEEGQESEPLRDYYRMDLDGLVADLYRPRVIAYFDLLRQKIAERDTALSYEELDPIYSRIERDFIAAPVRSLPEGEDPVGVIREFVAADSR